jgi:hypothetical protein
MSVELVKGYSSVLSLLHIYIFVVALSSSFLILDWRVLSFESTCDFHIFFPRLIAWFSSVVCVQKRGRKRLCVCMSTVVYLHNRVCSFLYAMCSYSFYRWKKRQKERERKKRCKKTYIEYLLIFYFSVLFFLDILFFVLVFDRNKKHRNTVIYKRVISILDHHYCCEWRKSRIKCKERNDDLFICLRMENYDCLFLMTFSAKKIAKENNREMKNRICLTRRHSVCVLFEEG